MPGAQHQGLVFATLNTRVPCAVRDPRESEAVWIAGHRQNRGQVDRQALLLVNMYTVSGKEGGQSVAPPQATWLVPAAQSRQDMFKVVPGFGRSPLSCCGRTGLQGRSQGVGPFFRSRVSRVTSLALMPVCAPGRPGPPASSSSSSSSLRY